MDPAKILIIEDDVTLSEQLANLLRGEGFDIIQAQDGQTGLLTALSGRFDLILLDVLLPTLDGFSVLKRLRKSRETPVMMLTACGAEEERIEGYSKGADDYLPKPFNFREILLRIEALLRRTMRVLNADHHKQELTAGDLHLSRIHQKVTFASQDITLTPIQFRLLWVMVDHCSEILTKPYLYQLVLERGFSRYDRSLDMHMSRIRKKLVEAGMLPERLHTVHGKGYRFS